MYLYDWMISNSKMCALKMNSLIKWGTKLRNQKFLNSKSLRQKMRKVQDLSTNNVIIRQHQTKKLKY